MSEKEPNKKSLEERFETSLSLVIASIPPDLRALVEASGQRHLDDLRSDIGDSLRELAEIGFEPGEKSLSKTAAQYAILKAIMQGDLTGKVNEDVTERMKALATLAVSIAFTSPIIVNIKDGQFEYDFKAHAQLPKLHHFSEQLVKYIAPYLAVAFTSDPRGFYQNFERAIQLNHEPSLLKSWVRSYTESCLDDVEDNPIVDDQFAHAISEPTNKAKIMQLCWEMFCSEYLWKLVPDYVSIITIAKLKEKGANIKASKVHKTIALTFEELKR